MATEIQPQDLQTVETVVAGPDGATRLFLFAGTASLNSFSTPGLPLIKETFTFLIGPTLTQSQFRKALASVSLGGFQINASNQAGNIQVASRVNAPDADWDDESGRIQVRFEVSVSASTGTSITVFEAGFHVAVLAALP